MHTNRYPAARTVATCAAVGLSLAVGAGMMLSAQTTRSQTPRKPDDRGANLEGRDFSLPRDFEGEQNLVFVAFQREQQEDVDTWVPLAKRLARERPGLRYYEIPTLNRGWRLFRPMIDGGMRGGIPDRSAREATITLYIAKEPFRQALGIPDEERIHTLLVDRAGRVTWRADGPFTPDKGAALERALGPATAPRASSE